MATKASKRGRKSGSGSAVVWLFTRIVLPLVVLYGLLWWRADAAVDKQLAQLRPFVDIQRGVTVLGFNGDIGFKKLVMRPQMGSPLPAVGMTADRVVLQTPGLLWLVKSSLLGVPEEIPSRFGIRLENARLDGDTAALQAAHVGGHVFFPFDLAGCEPAMSHTVANALGVDKAVSNFSFLMSKEGNDGVTLRFEADSQAVAKVSGEMKLTLAPGSDESLRVAGATLQLAQFTVMDQGFVATRNAYCAKKLAVEPSVFLTQHLAAVRSQFAQDGIAPGAALTQAYEGFSTEGGTLAFQLRPLRPSAFVQMKGVSLESLPVFFDATVKHNDDFVAPLTFVSASAVPVDAVAVPAEGAAPAVVPATVPAPDANAPVAAAPVADALKPGDEIPYDALPNYIGRQVEVDTRLGTTRRGVLTGASSISIIVKLAPADGNFPLSLPSNTVVKVRLAAAQP